MKKIVACINLLLLLAVVYAQPVTLTFTGRDAQNKYVPLNRVVVRNITKGWQETLIWPDSVLVMVTTGIEEAEAMYASSLRLSQNNPNPFDGTTFVNLQVADQGDVVVQITDITGRIIETNQYSSLSPGIYGIRITLSSTGTFFLTVLQNGRVATVKMVNRSSGGRNDIALTGAASTPSLPQPKKAYCGSTDSPFTPGDQMEYVGFAILDSAEVQSGHVVQAQNTSQTVVLAFVGGTPYTGSPCPDMPTVTDIDGNVYNTVQIYNRCWMKENLRTTHYADGTAIPEGGSNVSDTLPYYYDYSSQSFSLEKRGYLYNWPAAMHGESSFNTNNPHHVQGICPEGWHLPYLDWMSLFVLGSFQSEFVCDSSDNLSIAKALASTEGWHNSNWSCEVGNDPSSNNATGFTAYPAGKYDTISTFNGAGYWTSFWSSKEDNYYVGQVMFFSLNYNNDRLSFSSADKYRGYSVRCARDWINAK